MTGAELVEEHVDLGSRTLRVLRPPSPDELIDEEAFEREELLPYWAELWPSGVALARRAAARDLRGVRVLELGCGLAVPSIAAALAGARVLATDWAPAAVEAARRNAALNGAALRAALLRWDDVAGARALGGFDLVLAADVLYERRNVPQLRGLLPAVVAPGGEALLADPGRAHAPGFLELVTADGWSLETSPDPLLPRGGVHRLWRHRVRSGTVA